MPEPKKMTSDETKIVNMIYSDVQAVLERYSLEASATTGHALTAMVLLMIGHGVSAGISPEGISAEFRKIANYIDKGDYDDFIEKTKMMSQPPTDTVQ